MIERHLLDDLPGLALNLIDEAEAGAIRDHLAACQDCSREFDELTSVVDDLALAAQPVRPSLALRARILKGLPKQRSKPAPLRLSNGVVRSFLAVAATVLVFAIGFGAASLISRLGTPPLEAVIERTFDPARVEMVALQPTELAPGASARAYYMPDRREIVLAVEALPPLPPDRVYQLWANLGTRRWGAGTFTTLQGLSSFVCPREMGLYDSIGVTIEPVGGMDQPTGPRVLAARLTAQAS